MVISIWLLSLLCAVLHVGGNVVETTDALGRESSEEERVFDALNRPVSITESGRTTSYYYDLAGRAVGQLSGNGQWGTSHYDAQGRLVRRTLREGAGGTQPVLAELAFHHDAVGNLRQQEEWWPGEISRSGVRATMLAYDNGDRLRQELVNDGNVQTGTDYHYDQVGNRTLKVVRVNGAVQKQTTFSVNAGNQLMSWTESNGAGVVQRSAGMSYNAAGDRITQTITPAGGSGQLTSYAWDYDNRLTSVTLPDSSVHTYTYDYRMRRVTRSEPGGNPVAMTFSGGLSVAEYEVLDSQQNTLNSQPTVEYQRGPDMGGGVGGLLYSLRSGTPKFNLSNGRGDVVAQSDSTGALTWTASYEAYGKRPVETGSNADRQRANSKEEDPTGLLNEGWRYRDLETGTWLSRDPAGFVDGPNLYAYVRQNPWTLWDPRGLSPEEMLVMEQAAKLERKIRANPNPNDKSVQTTAAIAGGFVPGVGELQDLYTLGAPDSSGWDRVIAVGSLALNAFTGGFAPNFGGPAKMLKNGVKEVAPHADEAASAMTNSAQEAAAQSAAKVEAASATDSLRAADTNVAGSSLNVNPTGGDMNCVNCAISMDSKLAGTLTSAMPGTPTRISILEDMYGGTFQSVAGPIGIGNVLTQSGNGARGIVFGASTTGDVGHVWNAINQQGTIRFLDGQTGAVGAKALENFDNFADFQFLLTSPGK